MKKLILVFIILAIIGFVGYRLIMNYLPKTIANAVISETEINVVPSTVKEKVENMKEELDVRVDEMAQIIEESELNYDDMIEIIDQMDFDEFNAALEELKTSKWETTNEVFDIGLKHFSVDEVDLEIFRSYFNAHASTESIKEGLKAIEDSGFLSSMAFPIMKETAKNVIESKQKNEGK